MLSFASHPCGTASTPPALDGPCKTPLGIQSFLLLQPSLPFYPLALLSTSHQHRLYSNKGKEAPVTQLWPWLPEPNVTWENETSPHEPSHHPLPSRLLQCISLKLAFQTKRQC